MAFIIKDKSRVVKGFQYAPFLGSCIAGFVLAIVHLQIPSISEIPNFIFGVGGFAFWMTILGYFGLVIAIPLFFLFKKLNLHQWWIYSMSGMAIAYFWCIRIFKASANESFWHTGAWVGVACGLVFWWIAIRNNTIYDTVYLSE